MTEGEFPLLVLDLDETIIYSADAPLPDLHVFRADGHHTHVRPYLESFLEAMSQHFRIAVWTAASMGYATTIVQNTFPSDKPPLFVWGYKRCTLKRDFDEDSWVATKPLVKIRRSLKIPLSRILIVEDDPLKVKANYGNAVYVKPFQGDPADDELKHLVTYLTNLAKAPDFRKVEKRGWRRSLLQK